MKFDLPPTSTEQPPLFLSAADCREWHKTLPLSNPIQAQAQLSRQLGLLLGYALAANVRIEILEALREPLHFLQNEVQGKFSGKPLPLAPMEQTAFDNTHKLWRTLASCYLRCADNDGSNVELARPQAALVCQRALAALADDFSVQVQAGTVVPDSFWAELHAVYLCAETLAATSLAVDDPVRSSLAMTPAAAYVETLLMHAASLHELVPRHRNWVMHWARRWAGKVTICSEQPSLDASVLPLCVDLEGSAPAGFKPLKGMGVRWLENSELRKSLKKRMVLLAKGDPADTPARLGLGEDCIQPACEEVLKRTYPRWLKGGVARRQERQLLSGNCRFVAGVDAIHYYLSGREPFKPPSATSGGELRRQREEMAVFGRVAERFEEEYSRNHGYALENWEVIEDWGISNHSGSGLRLLRPIGQSGGRLGIGQLVAVQPAGSNSLVLGMVRWAQVAGDQLIAGIMLMPGKPLPVAVRGTGVMASRDPTYRPGFLLPPLEALGLPSIAVLPPGSFKAERIMEAWASGTGHKIRLKEMIERGPDFDCVSFDQMPEK